MVSWLLIFLLLFVILLLPTAYAGLIGAPYVPVRRPALKKAFDALTVGPNDVVADLGCGDGGVLIEAARRGARAIGYELSPIMWPIARLRAQWVGSGVPRPRVYLRNFFRQTLPADTTIIFFFLMPKALPRLVGYLDRQHLPRAKYLLSYTFALPGRQPLRIIQTPVHGTIYIYAFKQ